MGVGTNQFFSFSFSLIPVSGFCHVIRLMLTKLINKIIIIIIIIIISAINSVYSSLFNTKKLLFI